MIIQTGMNGMVLWNLVFASDKFKYKITAHFINHAKYSNKRLYISLFKKSGNIKIAINKDTYNVECYDGTILIHTCKGLNVPIDIIK